MKHGKPKAQRQSYRTHKKGRKVKIILCTLLICLAVAAVTLKATGNADTLFSHVSNLAASLFQSNDHSAKKIDVEITAANAYVMNAGSNATVYGKNADDQIAPASTVKMLTALTALDHCSLDDVFTVGAEIELIEINSSTAWLSVGDTLTLKQLLTAMLLPSGNDAAYTIAVNAGKVIDGNDSLSDQEAVACFVKAMNEKAADIGTNTSTFLNPDGYDQAGQYTTAYDLAQIAKACLKLDSLTAIMGSYSIYDVWPDGKEVTYYNSNELINPESVYYDPDVIGLKTGNSGSAGACLVSAVSIDGETYICVVMGSTEDDRYTDSLSIFEALQAF